MFEGYFVEKTFMHDRIRPYPIEPQITSGLVEGSQMIYRYALRESDYPTLIIVEPIRDGDSDFIAPGHYELALSDERDFLILLQSKEPVAIIPVFKVEEDDLEKERLKDTKYQKQLKKEAKEKAKTNAKRARKGMPPVSEHIDMDASIEYNKEGDYYLIKYQRATIKAWGVIKK